MQMYDLLFFIIIFIVVLFVFSVIRKTFKKIGFYRNKPVAYKEDEIQEKYQPRKFDYSNCNIRNRTDLINFIDSINIDKVFKIKEEICVMESHTSTLHNHKKEK